MLILIPFVVAAVIYSFWNFKRPPSSADKMFRAGVITAGGGLLLMPFLWWSGVPEVALVAGAAMTVVSRRLPGNDTSST